MASSLITTIVLETLKNFEFHDPAKTPAEFTVNTVLFGSEGVLDSVALVSFILDVEENIRARTGVSITLADDRAMSQSHSPFRRVSSLADYAAQLVAEQQPKS